METQRKPPTLDFDAMRAQMEIVGTSLGAWKAQVLQVGVRVGVFEEIGEGAKGAGALADALSCPRDSLERLLIAAHATGLLERDGDAYRNGPTALAALLPGSPAYVGNWIRLMSHWFRPWADLEQAVRTGKNVEPPELHLGENPEYTRDFIQGMQDYARSRGNDVVRHLDLSESRRLVDVGGGPGTYSILFARHHPELECTVFDLPEVVGIADENIREAGLEGRVVTRAGDYHQDSLGGGYDVVFISDVLHQESPESAARIVANAFDALEPGGKLVVQGMFMHDDHSGPEWPALYNIMLLLLYPSGRAYSAAETRPWLEAAGFRNVAPVRMSFYNVNSLLIGHRP